MYSKKIYTFYCEHMIKMIILSNVEDQLLKKKVFI